VEKKCPSSGSAGKNEGTQSVVATGTKGKNKKGQVWRPARREREKVKKEKVEK